MLYSFFRSLRVNLSLKQHNKVHKGMKNNPVTMASLEEEIIMGIKPPVHSDEYSINTSHPRHVSQPQQSSFQHTTFTHYVKPNVSQQPAKIHSKE